MLTLIQHCWKLCFGDLDWGHISFEETQHHTFYQPLTQGASTLLPGKLFRCHMNASSWGTSKGQVCY